MATLQLDSTPATSIFLEQTRIIRAPRARVYQAWTNPELLKQWFGNASKYCPSATLDVRIGGSYRIEVAPIVPPDNPSQDCGSSTTAATGTYTRIVPYELLQFTWSTAWSPGEESLVTVTFKDADGGTQLTIFHDRFATEQSRDAHNQGWAGCFDKLEAVATSL